MKVPIAYKIPDACAITGIGKSRLYQALDSGELPAKKYGKSTLILRTDLQEFLSKLEPYVSQVGGKNV